MPSDVTYVTTGRGRPPSLSRLFHSRWPLLWLAIALGGALLLTLVFARMVSAAGEGFSFSPDQVSVDEGSSATYTVALTGDAPDANVVVAIATSNSDLTWRIAGSSSAAGTGPLTFTPDNHDTPQAVEVFAGSDTDARDEIGILTHSVAGNTDYGLATVDVTIVDADTAGITLSSAKMVEGEGDAVEFDPTTEPLSPLVDGTDATATATYSVVLDSEPTAEVTVTITRSDVGDDLNDAVTLVGADPETETGDVTLTFSTMDYATPQPVTVTLTADADTAAEAPITLTHTITSSDEDYAALEATVMLTFEDEDAPGVMFGVLEDIGEGGSDSSYTVVLDSQPTANVTVTITSGDNGAVQVRTDSDLGFGASASLMFTTANYEMAQTVTVKAPDDADAADESVTLSHAVASDDANFNTQAILDAEKAAALAGLAEGATDEAKAEAEADAAKSLNVTVNVTDTTAGIRIASGSPAFDSETNTLKLVDGTDGAADGEADGASDVLTAEYTLTLQAALHGQTVIVAIARSDAGEDVERCCDGGTRTAVTFSSNDSWAEDGHGDAYRGLRHGGCGSDHAHPQGHVRGRGLRCPRTDGDGHLHG